MDSRRFFDDVITVLLMDVVTVMGFLISEQTIVIRSQFIDGTASCLLMVIENQEEIDFKNTNITREIYIIKIHLAQYNLGQFGISARYIKVYFLES